MCRYGCTGLLLTGVGQSLLRMRWARRPGGQQAPRRAPRRLHTCACLPAARPCAAGHVGSGVAHPVRVVA